MVKIGSAVDGGNKECNISWMESNVLESISNKAGIIGTFWQIRGPFHKSSIGAALTADLLVNESQVSPTLFEIDSKYVQLGIWA